MKKLLISFGLSLFCICAHSQDSMNKKIENRTDKMNKKMENPNDPMNKKPGIIQDTTNGKMLPQKSDSLRHKTAPARPNPKHVGK